MLGKKNPGFILDVLQRFFSIFSNSPLNFTFFLFFNEQQETAEEQEEGGFLHSWENIFHI